MEPFRRHQQRILTIFSILFVFSLLWAMWPFITNPTSVTAAYESAGVWAPFVFLFLVAIVPIPSAVLGASGVAYFGQWQGMLLLYIGNVLAVLFTFALVRWFGRTAIERFLEPGKLAKVDAFIARHPFVLWMLYALPLFVPIQVTTAVVALSHRPFRSFIIIPVLALPLDAFIVTSIGSLLNDTFMRYIEYASVVIVVLMIYAITHFLYKWKRDEIRETGRRVVAGVTRVGRAAGDVTIAVGRAGYETGVLTTKATVALGKATVKATVEASKGSGKVAVAMSKDAGKATGRAIKNASQKAKEALRNKRR